MNQSTIDARNRFTHVTLSVVDINGNVLKGYNKLISTCRFILGINEDGTCDRHYIDLMGDFDNLADMLLDNQGIRLGYAFRYEK